MNALEWFLLLLVPILTYSLEQGLLFMPFPLFRLPWSSEAHTLQMGLAGKEANTDKTVSISDPLLFFLTRHSLRVANH